MKIFRMLWWKLFGKHDWHNYTSRTGASCRICPTCGRTEQRVTLHTGVTVVDVWGIVHEGHCVNHWEQEND